jgi:DNA repair protein RadA/Sms
MASGLDQNRLSLLLAVLEKRAGVNLIAEDVFVNVAGGIAVDEPAADLGIVAAIASSVRNRPITAGTAVFGEVGLAGEVRGISQSALRLREVGQMGFTRCVVPQGNCSPEDAPEGLELVQVRTVSEALDTLMEW